MNANEEYEGDWYGFDSGATINEYGEYGVILRDEQLGDEDEPEDADARVTLEQGRAETPGFFITATLYGWLFVTAKRASQNEAEAVYEAMKTELVRLATLIPYEEDGKLRVQQKAQALTEAAGEFERQYQ